MVKFPNFLKPYLLNENELVRVGSIDDGGYVVPLLDIKNSQILISMVSAIIGTLKKIFLKSQMQKF